MVIGRRRFALRPGDVTITPPRIVSKYRLAAAGYHWCVHFHPEDRGDCPIALPLHLRGRNEAVADRFRAMADTGRLFFKGSAVERQRARAAVGAMLQSLLLRLALEQSSAQPPAGRKGSDTRLDEIRQQLDEEFRSGVSVARLARESGLSRNYFTVRFRQRFGVGVDQYLLLRRIELARSLLLSSELPIKEIAFECGIPDPQYFNKQFRRVTGMSPTAYRFRMGK